MGGPAEKQLDAKMIQSLTPLILITFFNMKSNKNEKVALFKNPIMTFHLSHFTPRNAPFLFL